MSKLICPYCGGVASLKDSDIIYNGKSFGMVWVCENYPTCDAYVGVHKSTNEPLGRLANPELREAKKLAHAAFDPIWKNKKLNRHKAYKWLSETLNINLSECHIGMFDVADCMRVVEACNNYYQV